ncbi:hypothetical protein FHR72_000515 [Mycolicibacterium iranicum]|uniref:GPP34 family phosphoprotein n=1 Tax=Mycolicibacterium iranicum TaxID=912594 RepID=A0A839PXZ6_MYCIR|nr:GPP34 family phosphoprotein [Mycolicibacterium iranicum]MBB2989058.1 hypothetical protein [Mycolicibacterium iranicum]
MTDEHDASATEATPTLAEDLLLLLFQPRHGTIAGETTLHYVLGAAVLADLALAGRVTATSSRSGSVTVAAVDGQRPSDELFHPAWEYLSPRPRGVQAVLAAIGPQLRAPVLNRLIARGDIRKERRKVLRLFTTTALVEGGTGRRADLLDDIRAVLVDPAEPTPRTAALTALLWASGSLPQFHPVIPWTTPVITRAGEIARGNVGASAAGEAVTRTMNAIVINSVIVATAVRPPG